MSFIKKNVNVFLLLLILMIMLSFVGVTTYYQTTYQNLSNSFNTKLSEVDSLTQALTVRRTELNKTYSELQIRMADKARFDKLYADLTNEKGRLEAELAATENQLKTTQDELTTTGLKLEEARNVITELQQTIETYRGRVSALDHRINELKAKCGAPCEGI